MMCMFADMNMCVYGTEIEIGCAAQLLFIFFLWDMSLTEHGAHQFN